MESLTPNVSDTVSVRTATGLTTQIDGREAGIRFADSDRHAASADLNPDGSARVGVQGVIPSGHVHELPIARVFVEYRRGLGARLGEPRKFEGQECGVDCIADNLDDAGDPLRMQITTAIRDPSYWRKQARSVDRELCEMSVDELVSDLWRATDEKLKKQEDLRYPLAKDTILLLSAWLSLAHATSTVAEQFRAKHGRDPRLRQFREVLVVGFNAAHTFRLDTE